LQKKRNGWQIEKAFLMVAVLFKNFADLDSHQQLLMAASDMLIEIYTY
jgi:predicted NAD-dependent protein-ADP-ribosyltransferase YbiA (DUF1768 family)